MSFKSKAKDPWSDDLKDPHSQAIAGFLRQLPKDEVFGLVKTTTGGLISPENIEEAIAIIINFSDAVSLLNRRRVKKEYLVSYLAKQKVKFSFQSDKSKLCNLVLKVWGQPQETPLKFESDEKPKVKSEDSKDGLKKMTAAAATSPHAANTSASATEVQLKKPILNNIGCQTVLESNNCQTLAPFYSSSNNDCEDTEMSDAEENVVQTTVEAQTGQALAFQFTEWFYPRLNKLEDFTPAHFWKDCNFRLQIDNSDSPKCMNVLRDGDTVCLVLRSLVAEEGCFFNPNTMNGIGIRGKINPHGLAQVMVCGTVHRGTASFGTFEQTFGLMKDPAMNNSFKIKFTLLRVRERSALMSGHEHDIASTTLSGIIEEIDD